MQRCSGLRATFLPPSKFLVAFFLFIGFTTCNSAKAATSERFPLSPHLGSQQSFAFGDLDGDAYPDSANVWSTGANSAAGEYVLELRLSSAGRQSISFVGPAGGLVIEARDVNGDHALDLILATAWFKQPVAVFLNDGHGNFSRAELAQFPGSFTSGKRTWSHNPNFDEYSFALPTPSRSAISAAVESLVAPRPPTRVLRDSDLSQVFDLSLLPHAGRAPPSRLIRS